jgi:PKD repeat protein
MKKFIFYQLKSIQEYCLTFSCNLNAGFSSFFVTNKVVKKLFFYGTLLLLVFGQTSIYGQAVSGAAVKANFGIDADVYANRLQFGVLSTTTFPNTDDWFLNISKWPGSSGSSGFGVIDESFPFVVKATPSNITFDNLAALITYLKSSPGKNFPFERRMSQAKGTTWNNYLWLDAVYGRDGIATQGYVDATVFTKTTDKNGQDPTTWNLGTGGTPAKNDIVDVVAHLRGEGLRTPTPDNPRPFTTLWGFGGATTISADGNSHNDFEFFRKDVTFEGGKLINSGVTGEEGHTAWHFDATGKPTTPGDILISVDFENGGTRPLGSVRVWMRKIDAVAATFNVLGGRKFDITGVFDGTSGAIYGYAEIAKKGSLPSDPNAVNPDIFAVVNVTADTFGAPWGSLEGQNTKYFEDIKKLQFSEFGINLTAFGLDEKTDQSTECASLLGTLIVKTRSSSSFTAELKDFAGPYQFGNAVQPAVNLAGSPTITCTVPTATITASNVSPSGSTVTFYGPASTANGGLGPVIPADDTEPPQDLTRLLTPGTNIPNVNGTYKYAVVVSATGFQGCEATAYVDVVVNKVPPLAAFSTSPVCLGTATSFTNTSTGATLTYSWDFGDGTLPHSTATNPTHTYAAIGSYTVTLTVTSGAGGTGCTASVSHTAIVNLIPVAPNVDYIAPLCNETTFSITITGVTSGAIYAVKDKNGQNISGIVPGNSVTAGTADITFSNIPAGSGYQVSVSVNGCISLPEVCPKPTGKLIAAKTSEIVAPIEAKTESAGFDAYPVPFKDQLTIKYKFDYVSDTKIEVFNAQGILVFAKTDSNSYLNKEIALDLKLNKGKEQMYVVKLTTNRGSTTKKVISTK